MIIKNHNDNSKQLLQKVLIYIDSILLNATTSEPENTHKVLLSGLINVRDALFSEIIKDEYVEKINQRLDELVKKNEKINQKDLNQETESVKDPQA